MATINPNVSPPALNGKAKPQPKDLSHHFSNMANLQAESAIAPYVASISATVTNIGAGTLFPALFPIDSLEGAIAKPNRFPLYPISPLSPPSTEIQRFTIPKYSSATLGSIDPKEEVDLATALQYQSSTGYVSLAAFINDFALNHQNQGRIPYANPGTLMTGGGDDGIAKCFSTFANSGDNILMEEYVYFTARDSVLTFGVGIVTVKIDDGGIVAADLEHTLSSWDEKKRGKKPHMLYTVSLGHNPTGLVTSLSRKMQIYKICQQHDILIFEDEPFWALQYNIPQTTDANFLATLLPSYLTIDTDGRVLGIQTFSKIMAPGCRLGWIVAQPAFIEKLTFLTDNSTQNPSGFAEVVLAQIFKQWGIHGFVRWIDGVRINYRERRNVLSEALAEGRDIVISYKPGDCEGSNKRKRKRTSEKKDHSNPNPNPNPNHSTKTKIRIYDFTIPPAASFIWVRLDFTSHPLKLSPSELIQLLWKHLISPKYNLLTLPGSLFAATPEVEKEADDKGVGHLRLSFAAVDVRDLRRAGEVFGEAVKTFWKVKGWDLGVLEMGEEEDEKERGRKMKRAIREYLGEKGLL